MKTSDFYFDLPQELIAQDPLEDRSSSRLLVLDRESGKTQHRVFRDIIEYLEPGRLSGSQQYESNPGKTAMEARSERMQRLKYCF